MPWTGVIGEDHPCLLPNGTGRLVANHTSKLHSGR
jgi:hypothetical protein